MNAYCIERADSRGTFVIHGDSFIPAFLKALCLDWSYAKLRGITLANVGLNADEFSNGHAEGIRVNDSTFKWCEFRRQRMAKSIFAQTVFDGCDFTDTDFSNASFTDCEFRGCRFADTIFTNACFKWSLIHRCRMDNVHMTGVRLYGTAIPVDFCLSVPCCAKGEFPLSVMAEWVKMFGGKEQDGKKLNKALHKVVVQNAEDRKILEEGRVCPYCKNDLVLGHGPVGEELIMCASYPKCSYTKEITAKAP